MFNSTSTKALGKATSPEQLADRSGEVSTLIAKAVFDNFNIMSDAGNRLPRSVLESIVFGLVRSAYLQGYSDATAYVQAIAPR